jgi:hypothetical protein
VSFEGRLRVEGVSIDRMRSDLGFSPEIRGSAGLEAEFQSRGPSARDLTAAGRAWVRDGDLGALPAVATIPALLSSAMPNEDPPRFERAEVEFSLRDETLDARRIVLAGPLFRMEGHGSLDFDGRVDFVFAPQFLKTMLLPGALDVPVIGDILGLFREDPVYVVRAHGTLGSPRVDVVPFPFLSGWRDEPAFLALPFSSQGTRRVPRLFH